MPHSFSIERKHGRSARAHAWAHSSAPGLSRADQRYVGFDLNQRKGLRCERREAASLLWRIMPMEARVNYSASSFVRRQNA